MISLYNNPQAPAAAAAAAGANVDTSRAIETLHEDMIVSIMRHSLIYCGKSCPH